MLGKLICLQWEERLEGIKCGEEGMGNRSYCQVDSFTVLIIKSVI
jgi:hypothetical protein